jgi:hypothetical protein
MLSPAPQVEDPESELLHPLAKILSRKQEVGGLLHREHEVSQRRIQIWSRPTFGPVLQTAVTAL